jgi:hypothetical protein
MFYWMGRALRSSIVGLIAALVSPMAAHADVVISSDQTRNMNCSGGICSPTTADAVLNVSDLTTMLSASDVEVMTGSGAVNIDVVASLTWATTSRLTLDAEMSVSVQAPMTIAGTGAITVLTNDGGAGGDLLFSSSGNLTFWDLASDLVINGQTYTLANDIQTLADDISANPSGLYALAKDYDAAGHIYYQTLPIPTEFAGKLQGLNHTIDHLQINRGPTRCVGLFGAINSLGSIRDLGLTNVSISSGHRKPASVGALVGCNNGNVFHDWATGSIIGHSENVDRGFIGGLVGTNEGVVENATANAIVSGDQYCAVGGLVGLNNGQIVRSHATGAVSTGSSGSVGGLVGMTGGIVTLSYATGTVTAGRSASAGGLVGDELYLAGNSISLSFSTGTVNDPDGGVLGGLAGTSATIADSYAIGSTNTAAVAVVGGLVGVQYQSIDRSYSLGKVTGGDPNYAGGLIAIAKAPLNSDYWNIKTTGRHRGCDFGDCTGATGLRSKRFRAGLPPGFDPSVWAQDRSINNGYPYLIANPPP